MRPRQLKSDENQVKNAIVKLNTQNFTRQIHINQTQCLTNYVCNDRR